MTADTVFLVSSYFTITNVTKVLKIISNHIYIIYIQIIPQNHLKELKTSHNTGNLLSTNT